MQFPSLLVIGALVVAPIGAQTTARLTVGGTLGTALASDQLGGPVSLGTGVPVTAALSVAHPIGAGYRALAEVRGGRGALRADNNGESSTIPGLTTVGLMLLVDGPLAHRVRWELGAGFLSYRPAELSGAFSKGGPTPWLLGAGLNWSRPLSESFDLVANGRYDFHQFRSRQLDSRGYTQYQSVHRIGLGVGIERSF
ncbi:MAG: hypothetical protein ABIR59_01310 [Gemmatimonadales bacterium]